jgi:hypothetical protein
MDTLSAERIDHPGSISNCDNVSGTSMGIVSQRARTLAIDFRKVSAESILLDQKTEVGAVILNPHPAAITVFKEPKIQDRSTTVWVEKLDSKFLYS